MRYALFRVGKNVPPHRFPSHDAEDLRTVASLTHDGQNDGPSAWTIDVQ